MAGQTTIRFQNSYARLPETFFGRVNPVQVPSPRLIRFNESLAKELNITAGDDLAEIFSGNRVAEGSEPLAMGYAGHQFGNFVPTLGDGRANLLGEVFARDGKRYDIHLKGSGQTPFSRRGDGKAALGPVLREYILSEAMHALGVPTTRALAAVLTGERVVRETMMPGAVFTRVAASHIRVGTFQYFAARRDTESLRVLADYVIERHYPDAVDEAQRYRALLAGIVDRQAKLIARWMDLGFVHGVMNTDNMAVSGETIDYGPCAFLESYHPGTVFSSIDAGGRYAFGNQPSIAVWNLSRLAEAMLPLLQAEAGSEQGALDAAYEVLNRFQPTFQTAHMNGLRKKLGLSSEAEEDLDLVADLLERMATGKVDYTLLFRRLCDAAEGNRESARTLFEDASAFDTWADRWLARLRSEESGTSERAAAMRAANPIYIPRNHLVQRVIDAAVQRDDFAPFHRLVERTMRPFEEGEDDEMFALPARPEELVTQTFCGT